MENKNLYNEIHRHIYRYNKLDVSDIYSIELLNEKGEWEHQNKKFFCNVIKNINFKKKEELKKYFNGLRFKTHWMKYKLNLDEEKKKTLFDEYQIKAI